jgi:predicted phage terminase large subunit-like protein
LPSGKPIWPEYWPLEQLEALRDELPLPKWQAQYQQQPTSDEGALVKREWWRLWEKKKPPECEFVIQSWDTAFLKNERADFSACTTWGVFYTDDTSDGRTRANVILLDAFKKRMEFPELKAVAYEHYKEWEPDAFIVEAKAAGSPLIFELRAMDIPVQDFTPTRGNDKIARVNAVSDLFASGSVWAPSTRWAEEVMEEFAEFPAGEHDDLVDSSTQALLRFRKGGFIQTTSDYEDTELPVLKRHAEYY